VATIPGELSYDREDDDSAADRQVFDTGEPEQFEVRSDRGAEGGRSV
jgi:hypothetical protein